MAEKTVKQYEVDGNKLQCSICNGDTFYPKKTILGSVWFTLFRLQSQDKTVQNFACSSCGYMISFLRNK
ncbi:MAG: hypothetical protein JKX84_07360 [Flavobacteriales bacterium]|nr:hypothetical protein [Flavobacteriales bacterium]